jgi:hypothetical protein
LVILYGRELTMPPVHRRIDKTSLEIDETAAGDSTQPPAAKDVDQHTVTGHEQLAVGHWGHGQHPIPARIFHD